VGKPGNAPNAPNYSSLLNQQQGVNLGNFYTQLGAGRPTQVNPYGYTSWSGGPQGQPSAGGGAPALGPAGRPGTGFGAGGPTGIMQTQGSTQAAAGGPGASPGGYTQTTGFSAPVAGVVNPALAGAGAAASAFSPSNNPTYQGPQTAGNLQFNPAGVAGNLYASQMGLLEPGMQSQSNALDQSLKAQGYDVNQAGGAQTAENNLMNQQNLVRAQTANWAAGQAIPQGAQQLAAQESIPLTQQNIAQGAFGAGVTGAQLPISEASGLMGIGLSPAGSLPTGAAQTPGLPGIDVMGAGQQNFANQMSGYNAGQAAYGNQMSGLLGLAGAGIQSYGANPSAWNNVYNSIFGA
jgi:hypothetical protein